MTPELRSRESGGLRDLVAGTMLFAATLAAYQPALHGGFLLDDDVHVTAPALRSLHGLARIWTEIGATQQYYPALHTAFWIEHRLWGDAPLGYHLLNVLLHAGAACLVVALGRQLRLPGAWIGGFIFALHPVCAESVAWIAEQKNTLSGVCYLGAALAYLRFDTQRRTAHYLVATGLFVLALLSKTATATLPAALLVIVWWRRSRLDWKRDALPLLPWCAAAALAGVVTIMIERRLTAGFLAAFDLTVVERCLLAGRALWFYVLKLVWPANLTFFYERWNVDAAVWWHYLFLFAVVAVAAGLAFAVRRTPARTPRAAMAALLIFAATLFPVLGFFNVEWFVFSFVADHLQYLASLAIIVPLSAGLAWSTALIPHLPRWLAPALASVLLAALGALTWRHSAHFTDNVTLYRHAVAHNPDSAVTHNHLGVALAPISGCEPEAVAQFQAALRINPDAAEVHENLGAALLRIPGRDRDAISHLEAALRLKPALANARFDLAQALMQLPGREADAIGEYEKLLANHPQMAAAHFNLGNALLRERTRLLDAIAHFEAALRLKPDFAEAHTNLGTALAGIPGRLPDAIAHFEAALRTNPGFAPARNNLLNAQRMRDELPRVPR